MDTNWQYFVGQVSNWSTLYNMTKDNVIRNHTDMDSMGALLYNSIASVNLPQIAFSGSRLIYLFFL